MPIAFRKTAAAALALVTTPLWAADLAERYKAMGSMSVDLDGRTIEMVIPYDRERNRAYAEQKMIMGSFLTINTVGRVVDDTGKPGSPMVQVTLQQQGGKMGLISAEMFDDQGFDAPLVMGADGGEGSLTSFSFEENRLEAEVQGTFLRLTGYMSDPKVAEDAAPLPVTIRWSVDVPPLDK